MAKADQKIIDRMEEEYQKLLDARAEGKTYNKARYNDTGIEKVRNAINQLSRKQIVDTACYGLYLFFIGIKGIHLIEEREDGWRFEVQE